MKKEEQKKKKEEEETGTIEIELEWQFKQ